MSMVMQLVKDNIRRMELSLRSRNSVLIAFGAGLIIGGGLVMWLRKYIILMPREVQALEMQMELLRFEVHQLRLKLDGVMPLQRHGTPGVMTISGTSLDLAVDANIDSTSDDEDLFEEALEGTDINYDNSRRRTYDGTTALAPPGAAQPNGSIVNTQELFKHVDDFFNGHDADKEVAYHRLQDHKAVLSHNSDFLWRLAKASYQMSQIESTRSRANEKKLLLLQAKKHALRALELDDTNSNVQKWCAITVGSLGDYESPQTKIENGYKFKEHIEKAIKLNPNDPSSHHLLGRWCYGVYMLSWWERQAAAALFSTPPNASIDEALQKFLEAEQLNSKPWKENVLYIAKCYLEKRDYATAVDWLDSAKCIPIIGQDDQTTHTEVLNLLKTYQRYRV